MSEIGKDAARAWDAVKGLGSDAFKKLDEAYANTKAQMMAPADPAPKASQPVHKSDPESAMMIGLGLLVLLTLYGLYAWWLRPKDSPAQAAARRVLHRGRDLGPRS